jgi:hypothetical protein
MCDPDIERPCVPEYGISRFCDQTELEDSIPDPDLKTLPCDRLRERMESMKFIFGGVMGSSQSVVVAVMVLAYVSAEDTLGREGVYAVSEGVTEDCDVADAEKWPKTLGRHLDELPAWGASVEMVLLPARLRVDRLDDLLCWCAVFLLVAASVLCLGVRGKSESREEGRGEPLSGGRGTAGEEDRNERLKLRNEEGVWRSFEVRRERVVVGVEGSCLSRYMCMYGRWADRLTSNAAARLCGISSSSIRS